MTTAKYLNDVMGANVSQTETVPASFGTGAIVPQFTLGTRGKGDAGSEYVYCKLVLASAATLIDGLLLTFDKDFGASLLSTSNSPRGQSVGACRAVASLPIGTHYLWLQVEGGAPAAVVATTPLANTPVETTATAGSVGAPSSATVGSKLVTGMVLTAANSGAAGVVEAILHRPYIDKTN